jgi:hypothetical protein
LKFVRTIWVMQIRLDEEEERVQEDERGIPLAAGSGEGDEEEGGGKGDGVFCDEGGGVMREGGVEIPLVAVVVCGGVSKRDGDVAWLNA